MIRAYWIVTSANPSVPRIRGDDPGVSGQERSIDKRSPHTRG